MTINNGYLLWDYITRAEPFTEEEFKELAEQAQEKGYLDHLRERIDERIEFHEFARNHFNLNGHPERAMQQEEALKQAQREAAIVQYLTFNGDFKQ
jgi:hypothetical protein